MPNKRNAVEFLLLNPTFTRSIVYSLEKMKLDLDLMTDTRNPIPGSSAFLVGKLCAQLKFMTIDEIEGKEIEFIEEIVKQLYAINDRFHEEFLSF